MIHKPVLVNEVLEYLNPQPGQNFIDGTVGQGGHAMVILEKMGPEGKLLGIDWDAGQVGNARQNLQQFGERAQVVHGSYANIAELVVAHPIGRVDGILLDLGFSSWQMDEASRGFAFSQNGPLDMRYDKHSTVTAEIIVNQWPQQELERIFTEYGEEKFARKIAAQIVQVRQENPIKSTLQLVEVIKQAIPERAQHGRIHYATRTFQALRMVVNNELQNVERGLQQAFSVLSPGGRLVVISFHSLEDRIVKNYFRDLAAQGVAQVLTKKPIEAGDQEVAQNPRARSAKLRAIVKT